jgi:hypothetical protein
VLLLLLVRQVKQVLMQHSSSPPQLCPCVLHEIPQDFDARKAELKGLQEQLLAENKGVREAEAGGQHTLS